jgi:uncharacterized protein
MCGSQGGFVADVGHFDFTVAFSYGGFPSREFQMSKVLLVATLCSVLLPGNAFSQAFNCDFAKQPDELAICRDDSLKALDEQMANRFFQIRQNLPDDGLARLKAEQKEFLSARKFCGTDGDCIAEKYADRLDSLCVLARDFGSDCP